MLKLTSAVPNFPRLMMQRALDTSDKENILREKAHISVDLLTQCHTPKRPPLQDVTRSTFASSKSAIKACYSQVTPATLRTPRRKSIKTPARPQLFVYNENPLAMSQSSFILGKQANVQADGADKQTSKTKDSETKTETDDSTLINTLVYNKVLEIVRKTQKRYEAELLEKDMVISQLQYELSPQSQRCDLSPANDVTDHQISGYVYSILRNTVQKIQSEMPEIRILPPTPEEAVVIESRAENTAKFTIDSDLNKSLSAELSDCNAHNASNTSPSKSGGRVYSEGNRNASDFGYVTIKVREFTECSSGTDVISVNEAGCNTHNIEVTSAASSPMCQLRPAEHNMMAMSVNTETKHFTETSTSPQREQKVHCGSMTSPLKTINTSMTTVGPETTNSSVMTDSTCNLDKSVETIGYATENFAGMTDNLEMVDVATETNGTTVELIDTCVGYWPDMVSMATGTSHTDMRNQQTCMTPHKAIRRFSPKEIRAMHATVIARHFETAALRNEHLKSDLADLRRAKEAVCRELEEVKDELHGKEAEFAIAAAHVTSSKPTIVTNVQNKIAFGTRIPTLQERRASKKRAIRRSETSFANNTMAKPETLEAAEIKQQLAVEKGKVSLLGARLDDREAAVEHLNNQLDEREFRMRNLEALVSELQAQVNTDHRDASELNGKQENIQHERLAVEKGKVSLLGARLDDREAAVEHLNSQLDEREFRMRNLEALVSELQAQVNTDHRDASELNGKQENIQHERSDDYQPHYEKAQEVIDVMKIELQKYGAETRSGQNALHATIKDSCQRVMDFVKENLDLRKSLVVQATEIGAKLKVTEDSVAVTIEEKSALDSECQQLNEMLETARRSLVDLESLYSVTSAALLKATNQILLLNTQLYTAKTDIQELSVEHSSLKHLIAELQLSQHAHQRDIQTLRGDLSLKVVESEIQKESIQTLEVEMSQNLTDHKDSVKQYELTIQNLQRTVDFLEDDIEVLEKNQYENCEIIQSHVKWIDTLETRAEEQLQKLVEADVQAKELQNAKESEKFLTQEHTILMSEVKELEANYKASERGLAQYRCDYQNRMLQCSQLQGQVNVQSEALRSTQEELESTRAHASSMLLQQCSEIQDCADISETLDGKMRRLLDFLKQKAGMNNITVPLASTKTEEQKPIKKEKKFKSRKSFVSSVLAAANDLDGSDSAALPATLLDGDSVLIACTSGVDDIENEVIEKDEDLVSCEDHSNINCQAVHDRLALSGYGHSAFTSLNSKSFQPVVGELNSNDSANSSKGSEIESTVDNALSEKIAGIVEMLDDVMRIANIVEKATKLSLQDIKEEKSSLISDLSITQQREQRLAAELTLSQDELATTQKEVESLRSEVEQQVNTIAGLENQDSIIKLLKENLAKQMLLAETLQGEKQLMTEQLEDVLQKMEQTTGLESSMTIEAKYQRQIVGFKKEIQQLRQKLLNKKIYMEEVGSKVSRRMKVLEGNWKKAEDEVTRLDDLVENIRQTFIKNKNIIMQHEDLTKLLLEIDGDATDKARNPLQPIKTAKW